jgi:dephospho-CoA kinase
MIIVGLTGSIGTGKSVAAQYLRERGIPVSDADALVHELYRGAAVPLLEAAFPGTTADGVVDRDRLAAAVMSEPDGFRRLEAIVHPLVRAEQKKFLAAEAARGARIAVLEIPLLFETGGESRVDVLIVTTAAKEAQRQRVLSRPGMTEQRFDNLLKRQVPDEEKRQRADFVVDTNGTITDTRCQLDAIIDALAGAQGGAYERAWS